jgi:glycerol-3-phosphate dehydrogenase
MQGKQVLRAGFLLYDFTVFDRNLGLRDKGRRIPWGRIISREQCLKLFPDLEKRGLSGAGIFYDAQFYNPPRLALAFLRSAVNAGAQIGNYLEVASFIRKGHRILGIEVKDVLTGNQLEIRGKMVLNASGPWADQLLGNGTELRLRPKPNFSRDAGFVVRGRLTGDYALACRIESKDPYALLSRKGRHIFMVPWRDYTLIGVWHVVHDRGPDAFNVTDKELKAFLGELNESYPSLDLTLEDISMVYAGLTLFGENRPGTTDLSFGHRSLLIDHAKNNHVDGLITLIGVRATTARGMAEKAINLVFKKLGATAPKSKTAITPVYGGRIDCFEEFLRQAIDRHGSSFSTNVIRSLVHNYGSEYREVLKYVLQNPTWAETVGNSKIFKAEIIHAVREEMAQKLGDVVLRRTELGTGGHPGENALQACADLMARELGWTENRVRTELTEVRASFPWVYK